MCFGTCFPLTSSEADAKLAVFDLYDEEGKLSKEGTTFYTKCRNGNYTEYGSNKQSVPLWILALGGIGIVAGLAMWGYRITVAIGVIPTKLTPACGISLKSVAAITVIIASHICLLVSTTHCQVGATMGVRLIEFKKSIVNWKQFLFICIGWVFTVIFTGFLSAGLFATHTYSPSSFRAP